ncbi:MAG: alpha-galactosidase [Anaerolineae bacterium]
MQPTNAEILRAKQWAACLQDANALPYTFTYDAKPARGLMASWDVQTHSRPLDAQRVQHVRVAHDPATGLKVRCVAVEYLDYPTVEWTVYLENTGEADTPIIADWLALDMTVQSPKDVYRLHHQTGSPCRADDYQPFVTEMHHYASPKRISADGGRPTNSDLPYFSLDLGGEGMIAVVAWPGQWAAEFAREGEQGLCIRAGQERTHFTLHPGESVRGPLVVLQAWEGDWIRGQNLWRRWMLAHNLPRNAEGKAPAPQLAVCNGNHFPGLVTNDQDERRFVDHYVDQGIQVDYWWQDAGWYPCNGSWVNVGTWEVNRDTFPGGIRATSDYFRAKGIRTIVWFEPERVMPGSWLYEQHPEWLLGENNGKAKLLNLGDPAARRWVTEHIDGLLTQEGIDLYRQDFNIDPLPFWRASDVESRQGITEIRYVEGYLAFWDELRRRHPGMLIDSCASGGRRNDLETLRRALPLLRTDYTFQAVPDQCQTYGISLWYPFYGTGILHTVNAEMPYYLRSCMCPHFTAGWDVRLPELDWDQIARLIAQWRELAPCLMGDFYPLTSYSLADDVWMAFQFDLPEAGEGLLEVFVRASTPYETATFRLRGLDPEATYNLSDVDSGDTLTRTGRELMEQGLPLHIVERPVARLYRYQRA